MPRADALPCLVLGTLALFTGAASLLRHRTTDGGRGGIGGAEGGLGLFGGRGGYGGVGAASFGGGGHPRPHERHGHGGHGGPRRALRQIARESEQVPFAFLPGTSGPAPNYWMLRDAHREIPATVAEAARLNTKNVHDAAYRSLKLPTAGQVILLPTTISRVTSAPWEWMTYFLGLENMGAILSYATTG